MKKDQDAKNSVLLSLCLNYLWSGEGVRCWYFTCHRIASPEQSSHTSLGSGVSAP